MTPGAGTGIPVRNTELPVSVDVPARSDLPPSICFFPRHAHESDKVRLVKNENGVSEVLDETLIIALGVVCAVIVAMLIFGFAVPIEKTAYVVPQFGTKTVAGHAVITVYDRGGDPVYFTATPLAKYKAAFYVDTPGGSYQATPVASLAVLNPGDSVYIYNSSTGYIVTNNLTGISATDLPAGLVKVRLVDINSGTLIAQETVVAGSTTTETATPVSTTAAPTPTATATSASTKTLTVRWSGTGYGSLSPPAKLTNGQEIRVPMGSSQTISFVPGAANIAVLTIALDGKTVYSGTVKGSTITYSVPIIKEDRELTATFG